MTTACRAALALLAISAAGCCCSPCCNYPCGCYQPCGMPCCEPMYPACGCSPYGMQVCSSCVGQPYYGIGSAYGQMAGMQQSAVVASPSAGGMTAGSQIQLVSQQRLQPTPDQLGNPNNQQQPGQQSITITQQEDARAMRLLMEYQICNQQRAIQILCRQLHEAQRPWWAL
jgi:hypothetical protein